MDSRTASRSRRVFRFLAVWLLAWLAAASQAGELRVASSGGFAAAWRVLAPRFEALSGTRVVLIWGPSMGATAEALPNRLARGEAIDVVIMVDDALQGLVRDRRVEADTRTVLARSLIALAVRRGAPRPDISTPEALQQALLGARSIAVSDSASGVYLSTTLIPRLGLADALRGKVRMIPAEPVGQVVARGDAELGLQQLSELKPVQGIDIAGLLPESLQQVTLYSAGVVAGSANAAQAGALVRFLASSEAAQAIRDSGLDPVLAASR